MKRTLHIVTMLAGMFMMVVSFQNCSDQEALRKSGELDSQSVDQTQFKVVPVNQIDSLIFSALPEAQEQFELDIATKEISSISYGANSSRKFCLSDEEKAELDTILYSISICIPEAPLEQVQNKVCAQVIVDPYAEIVADSSYYALGSKPNPCEQAVDLCGAKADLLKGFLAHIKNSLDSRACQ
jgi:hypothetical protein